jgi:hypothetical protein
MTNYSYLQTKGMLNVNAEGVPLLGINLAVAPGCGPRYLKETDEIRNLSSDLNVRA